MSNSDHNQPPFSRRDLCISAFLAVPAAAALVTSVHALAKPGDKAAAKPADTGGLKLVPETDPTAKGLKYVADASKAKREKKGDVEGKDQFCHNCQMYTKQGMIGGKEAGKCLMIVAGSVAANGWCTAWIKKA